MATPRAGYFDGKKYTPIRMAQPIMLPAATLSRMGSATTLSAQTPVKPTLKQEENAATTVQAAPVLRRVEKPIFQEETSSKPEAKTVLSRKKVFQNETIELKQEASNKKKEDVVPTTTTKKPFSKPAPLIQPAAALESCQVETRRASLTTVVPPVESCQIETRRSSLRAVRPLGEDYKKVVTPPITIKDTAPVILSDEASVVKLEEAPTVVKKRQFQSHKEPKKESYNTKRSVPKKEFSQALNRGDTFDEIEGDDAEVERTPISKIEAPAPQAVKSTTTTTTQHENSNKFLQKVQLRPAASRSASSDSANSQSFQQVTLRKVEQPKKKEEVRKSRSSLTVEDKLKELEQRRQRRRSSMISSTSQNEEDQHDSKEHSPTPPPRIREDDLCTVIVEHDADSSEELTVYVGEVVSVKLSKGSWSFAANNGNHNDAWVLVQKGAEQGLVPAAKLEPFSNTKKKANLKSGKGRGLDSALGRQMAAKAAAKYDPLAEALAQHWIEQVTGHVFRKQFADELRNGQLLCQLVNKIKPGQVSKIYEGGREFGQMDNIANFLTAVSDLGVLHRDQFETIDLFECRDLNLVVNCLFALSKTVMRSPEQFPDFPGPYLKPAEDADPAVLSNLKLIVAVNDYRDRNWHQTEEEADFEKKEEARLADRQQRALSGGDEDPEVVREAIEYRLAMLGLRDKQKDDPECLARAVNRADQKPAFLIVWSSSTKSSRKTEGDERRLVQILTAKRKRYELVYIDIAPDRKQQLFDIADTTDIELPALTFGTECHAEYEMIQQLEDEGALDQLLTPAEEGKGFWLLPDAWSKTSACLDGGGYQIVNDVVPM